MSHTCSPPDLAAWDHDEDWTCPNCGQDWFVGAKNYCHSCWRNDGPVWQRYGTLAGRFPLAQAARGGIRYGVDQ